MERILLNLLNKMTKPTEDQIVSYHFTDYWIRFGLVSPSKSIESDLYLGRYQIAIDKYLN